MSCAVVSIMFNYKGVFERMEASPQLKPIYKQVLKNYLIPLAPDPAIQQTLLLAGDETVRPQDLAPVIQGSANLLEFIYAQSFLAKRLAEWKEDTAGLVDQNGVILSRTLALLGKAPMRNLIACANQKRLAREGSEKSGTSEKKEEKPLVVPQEIPYALGAERACEEAHVPYPAAAFLAGLHYDWLAAVIKKRKGSSDEKGVLESSFKAGLLTAKAGFNLGSQLSDIELGKYLYASGLLVHLGKVLMNLLFPKASEANSWANFVTEAEDSIHHRYDRYAFLEKKRFGITHAELSSLLVNFGGLLRPTEKALCFYQDPWVLDGQDHASFSLAVALSVAVRHGSTKGVNTPLEDWQERWIESHRAKSQSDKKARKPQ
jgi:hypothetical protein